MSGTLFGPTLPRGGGSSSGGGVTTDRRAPAIIVGNALFGDTSADCDYLDVGDCVQLAAALATAYTGNVRDVWIRPGRYTLGAALAPLTIRPTVNVRGAGRGLTRIYTPTTGPLSTPQEAWRIESLATLQDIAVSVQPTVGPATGQYVLRLTGQRPEVHRVDVSFSAGWDAQAINNSALLACFGVDRAETIDAKLVDCAGGDLRAPLPSFIDLGGKPVNRGLRAVDSPVSLDRPKNSLIVERLISWGGDHGAVLSARGRIHSSSFYEPFYYGIWLAGLPPTPDAPLTRCKVSENEIVMIGRDSYETGIYLDESWSNEIIDNYLQSEVKPQGIPQGTAIGSNSSGYNQIRGNRCSWGWRRGISLSVGSDNNLVILDDMSNAATPYSDSGANNDIAHNK
jgi:hypothetical protein